PAGGPPGGTTPFGEQLSVAPGGAPGGGPSGFGGAAGAGRGAGSLGGLGGVGGAGGLQAAGGPSAAIPQATPSEAAPPTADPLPTFPETFTGFALSKAPNFILKALADVTKVRVLSAPQLLVLDNEPARLQVGQQVPVLTGQATSTLAAGAPTVNSIDYHATGVIMQVTPRVNSGGLVTLDIAQEVSDVAAPARNTAKLSPPF